MNIDMLYEESEWMGFRRIDFDFEGKNAILVFPDTPNENNNWIFKTEYFKDFPTLEVEMLNRGYHLAFLQNKNRWGLKEDIDAKFRFRNFLVKEFGLSPKCITVGMSCGGLFGIKLAGTYPEMVSVSYLDAPVVNLLSLIGMGDAKKEETHFGPEIYEALGTTRSKIISFRDHPLDYLPKMIDNRTPICLVYGDADTAVPCEENALVIDEMYSKTDIPFLMEVKEGIGHHPHGLEWLSEEQCDRVINFLIANDK